MAQAATFSWRRLFSIYFYEEALDFQYAYWAWEKGWNKPRIAV